MSKATQAQSRPHFLMCRPEHFGVIYSINPWMNPSGWARDEQALAAASQREWARLHRALVDLGAAVDLVPPAAGLPDLVFTANSAVVLDRTVLLARFRHPERQAEEAHYEAAFRKLQGHGAIDAVIRLPENVVLEGAGDCVFDRTRSLFWMGYGPRSDQRAQKIVADTFGVEVVAQQLADPRFYHMDTALCPLTGGELIYIPSAFTSVGRAAIEARVAPEQRIAVGEDDAVRLAANTVCVGNDLVMPACGGRLRADLEERGYRVHVAQLPSFLRSGGAAFCLTLRLDRASGAASPANDAAVA
jgi:N-dimethylarginine dimethylaminohydrolase